LEYDNLINFLKCNIENKNTREKKAFIKKVFSSIKHFFPFTTIKDFENCELLKKLIKGDEKSKFETKKSTFLQHMENEELKKENYTIGFNDIDIINNFSEHIYYYSIILYVNCALEIFKLIRKIKKFKARIFIKFLFYNLKLNAKNFFEKSNYGADDGDYSFSEVNFFINYNFFDPYEINGKTENNFYSSEFDIIQKIQYRTYLILYSYVPLLTYLIKRQIFKDEKILTDEQCFFSRPIDNSNFYSGDLPNLNNVLEKIDLLLRKKPSEENYYFFLFMKLAPTLCQIRDFENIIKTIYEKSKKTQILLNKAIECSVLGLYPFSSHDIMAKDFGSLLGWYSSFYRNDTVLKTSIMRSDLFTTFQENKVAIRTLSRTLYVFYIENYKMFKDSYVKMCWDGVDYITYDVFRNSNIINMGTLNNYFLLKQNTLKKYEEKIKIPKNSTISEKEKTALEDLLNNDPVFWEFLKTNKKNLDKKKIYKELKLKKIISENKEKFYNYFKIDLNNQPIKRVVTKEQLEKEFYEDYLEKIKEKKINYTIASNLQLSNLLAKITGIIHVKDTFLTLTDEQLYVLKNFIYKKFFKKYKEDLKKVEKVTKDKKYKIERSVLIENFFDLFFIEKEEDNDDETFKLCFIINKMENISIFDEKFTNEKETSNDLNSKKIIKASMNYNNNSSFLTEILNKISDNYEIILPCKKNNNKEKKVDHGWAATPNSRINTKTFIDTLLEKISIMFTLHFRIRNYLNSYEGMTDFSYATAIIKNDINNFNYLGGLSHDYNANIKNFLLFAFKNLKFSKKCILSLINFFSYYIKRDRPAILLNSLKCLNDREIMILLYYMKRDVNVNSLQVIELGLYHRIKVFFKKGIDSHNFINFMIVKPENYVTPDTMIKVFKLCFFYCCERVANLGKKSIKKNSHGVPSKQLTFMYNLTKNREYENILSIVDDTVVFSVDLKRVLKNENYFSCYLPKNKKKKKKVIKIFQNLNTNLIKYSKKNKNFENLISNDALKNYKETQNEKNEENEKDKKDKKNKNTKKEKKKKKEEQEQNEVDNFLKENFLKNKETKTNNLENDKLAIPFNINETNSANTYEKMCFAKNQTILIEKNDRSFDSVNSIHGKKFRNKTKKNLNIMNYLYKEINDFDIHTLYGKDPLEFFKPMDRLSKLILKSLLKNKNCYDNDLNRMEKINGIKYAVIIHKKNVSKMHEFCETCGNFDKCNNQLYAETSYFCPNCADKLTFFVSTISNFNEIIKNRYEHKKDIFLQLSEKYKNEKNINLSKIIKNRNLLAIMNNNTNSNNNFVFDRSITLLKNLKEIFEQITKIRLKYNQIINPQENLTKEFNSKILLKKDMEFHLLSDAFRSHWCNFLQKKYQIILVYDENSNQIKLFYLDKKIEKKEKNRKFLDILNVDELKEYN